MTKKSIMSKTLSVFLVCLLMIGLFPMHVFAENSETVTTVYQFEQALNDEEVSEMHISGNLIYKSELNTDKTIVIDSGSVLTWNMKTGNFEAGLLVINGKFVVQTQNSVVSRLHVYGTVENNGEIEAPTGGNCYWHAATTGDGSFVGMDRTYVDYGTLPEAMIPDVCKINLIKDITQTYNTYVTLDESKLSPGNTVTPQVSNLIDGVNVAEVFDIEWENPPSTSPLSNEPSYTIPVSMGGEKLRVSVTCKPGYAFVSTSGTRGTITSEDYEFQKIDLDIIYVDGVNGSNSNIGSIDEPVQTLIYALSNINDNGTIIMLNDYNSEIDKMYWFTIVKNVTIKGYGSEKINIEFEDDVFVTDGKTLTFENIDFGSSAVFFYKYNTSYQGEGNITFNDVTGSRVFVDDTKDVTISNSVIGGRFNPLGNLSINNSTVTGGFSCSNFVSTSDVNLSLNSCMVISDSITVDASNPVTVHPADLDNGELVIQLPSFNSSYESSFILDDTQNGKYALKCRETSNGAYLVVAEKASAQGPFHIAFVPEEEGEIAVNTAQNNYVAVPDGNGFTASSAVWSGYSDVQGKKWTAGDSPELIVTLSADNLTDSQDDYYFDDDFNPEEFTFYQWQDITQSPDEFYDNQYVISSLTVDIKDGQGVSSDGKTFTFTLVFPDISHNCVKINYVAPTCTTSGNIEYWYCNCCNKCFKDESLTKEISKDETVINSLNHSKTTLVNAKKATCTEDGYSGDVKCDLCQEIIKYGNVIPALGHNYDKSEFNWSENGKTCLVTFTCKNCGDIKTLNADISFTVKTEPTCTQKGVTAYKATVEFNGNVYTDIKNIADISETGHRFKDGVCLICGEKQENDNSETVTKAPGTTGDNNAADNDAVSKNDSEKSPQTGFNYVSVILTAIFIALTVFILACVTVNRKKFSIK